MSALHYRAVFLSDIHLGTKDTHCEQLLDFLQQLQCEQLYLLGDVIDIWKAKSGWHWPMHSHNVMHRILDKARRGTQVSYIPGNHDEALRAYADTVFEGVNIVMEAEHQTADGKRLLLLHGDEFDNAVRHSQMLHALGSHAYDLLLVLNRWQNHWRRRMGMPHWSLAGFIKQHARQARKHIESYERAAVHEASRRGYDGIVCGHIHQAADKVIDGIRYLNTGDWVENCTAIAEDFSGQLHLICWPRQREALLSEACPPPLRVDRLKDMAA